MVKKKTERRKPKTEIRLNILDFLLNSKEESISTNVIAKAIHSNFPTTKKFISQMADLTLLKKIIVDGKILGYSLNQELLSLLMASDFEEMCSLDWTKPTKLNSEGSLNSSQP